MNQTDNHAKYMFNLSKGQELYKVQRFEDALKYFNTALELEPDSHWAWNEKGNALRRLGRQREARDCYERAIHLDKRHSYPFPYIGVADIYRDQKQYSEAIAYYDRAIRIKRHPWALNGKGRCLHALNQTDEALRLAEESIHIRPEFLFPYILRGDILYERAAYRDALRSYQRAYELIRGPSPELRGEVKSKITQCTAMLDRDVRVEPGNQEKPLNALIRAFSDHIPSIRKKLHDAPAATSILDEKNGGYSHPESNSTDNHAKYMANLNKGKEFYKVQRFEDALKHFTTALELEPGSHWAWNEKGNALRRLGRQKEAIECYERAISLDRARSYPFPYIGIADIYREQKQYSEAIAYYDRAMRIKRHPWALNGKGMCLHARNQTDEALRLAEESIRTRPGFLFPYILRGDILYERAAYRDALRSYQNAFDHIHSSSTKLREEVRSKIAQCTAMLDRELRRESGNDGNSDVKRLLIRLGSEDSQDRIHASYQLDILAKGGKAGAIIRERAFDMLGRALDDSVPDVRRNILWVLGNLAYQGYSYEVAGSGILPEMAAHLDDPADPVCSAAAWSLAVVAEAGQGIAVADSGATLRYIRLLYSKNHEVQACAALALDKIAFYASPEPVVRNGGATALAHLLNVQNDEVRFRVLWALWSISCRGYADSLCDAETLVTDLKRCAQEKDLEIRKAAVSIIGELSKVRDKSFLQQKDLEKVLLTCIGSRSNRVRGAAIWAAGLWADAGCAPMLIQAGVKEAIRNNLDDRTRVHVFNHSEHRWIERSIGGIAGDVLKKIVASPDPVPPKPDTPEEIVVLADPGSPEPDYRTAYFVAQNLVEHLRQRDRLEARKSAIHLEVFVRGDILEKLQQVSEHLRFYIDEDLDNEIESLADDVELLKENILREAMR
nr:tetratricopeptide repeat protein [Methanoculleus marisnigri]